MTARSKEGKKGTVGGEATLFACVRWHRDRSALIRKRFGRGNPLGKFVYILRDRLAHASHHVVAGRRLVFLRLGMFRAVDSTGHICLGRRKGANDSLALVLLLALS